MKIKSIVTLSLLFVMSFSDTPQEVDVNCEIHCEYHHSYLPPKYNTFTILNASNSLEVFTNNSYIFQMNLKISKPPIT